MSNQFMTVKTVLIIEGIVNLAVLLLKLVVGLSTGSAAIVADALHSLTDFFNNIVAWIAVHIAEKPADEDHPYGHKKFESLAIFLLATLLCVVALEVLISAVSRFGNPVEQSTTGLILMAGVLVINILLSMWQKYWAGRLNSDILQADASHTFSDVLTTMTVIAGWQLAASGYYWIDTIFAIFIAFIIVYLAAKLFLKAVPSLVDQSTFDTEMIKARLLKVEHVCAVKSIRIRSIGGRHLADLTIQVEHHQTLIETHAIADLVENILQQEFSIDDVIVHMEPYLAINTQ